MIVKILFLNENGTFHVEIVNLEQRMSQGDVKYVRQLPNDKVYRNIFEAEVSITIVNLPCLRFYINFMADWQSNLFENQHQRRSESHILL